MLKLLVAVVLVAALATPAAAVHYETFGKPFGGLGGTTPSGQFSDIVDFTTASGIADGPGTYLVDTIDFTVIRHGIAQTITDRLNTEALFFDDPASLVFIPFTIGYTVTILPSGDETVLFGGNHFVVDGFRIALNPLTMSATLGGATVSGDLTATVTAAIPEPASWLLMIVGFGITGAGLRQRWPAAV